MNGNSLNLANLTRCCFFLAFAGLGGCHSRAAQLAAEVHKVGGEARVLQNGTLVINLSELRSSTAGDTLVEILGKVRASNQPFTLRLRGFDLDEEQLDAIAGCVELLEIDLAYCRIGSESISRLSQLKKLRSLSLASTRLPERDLDWLSKLTALEYLALSTTGANDATIARIAVLPHLEYLCLNQTEVTDTGLSALSASGSLKGLELSSLSGVTDEGITALTPLQHLDSLDIVGTKVTAQGLNKLLENATIGILIVGPVLMKDPQVRELESQYPETKFR